MHSYEFATGTLITSFALAFASTGFTNSGADGMFIAALAWPAIEHYNHLKLHKTHSLRHASHHAHSTEYPHMRVLLSRPILTTHMGVCWIISFFWSFATAMGYCGMIAILYACYEGAHEWGHIRPSTCPSLTWAILNSKAWHWQHHRRPGKNFGICSPFYDKFAGTADLKMLARYDYGWRKWAMPLPWVVFALTEPDLKAVYDEETEKRKQQESAEARWRQSKNINTK